MARPPRGSWSLSKTGSSLRYRNFRLLFIGTVFSHTGDFMQAMAQAWLVWTMTNSPFLLGLLGFCQAVPRLLLGAIGGALVDRLDRRRLLLLTQNLAMVQAFAFWALVYFDLIRFWHIVVLVLFIGTVNTLNQTARQSLINTLVPRAELMNAIALNSSIVNLSKVIGPSLGGVLIAIIGVAGCLLVNAVSFLAIILSLVMMDLPLWQREKKEENFWQEVIEGYHYVKTNHQVFSVLSLAYIVALIGSPYTRFLPVFATDIFHAGPSGFGLLLAAPGVGAVGSGLWLASMGNIRRRRNFVFLSVLTFSLFLMLFSFSRSMLLSLLCLVMVVHGQHPPPQELCLLERPGFFPLPDALFFFPLDAPVPALSRHGGSQPYRLSRRGQHHHSDGNPAPPAGKDPEPLFHGQGPLVVRHALYRQRRLPARDASGDRPVGPYLRPLSRSPLPPRAAKAQNEERSGRDPATVENRSAVMGYDRSDSGLT